MKAKVGRGNGFRGLLAYVFGAGEKGKHDRASVVGGNMVGTDPRGLAAEFAICRKLRPEVKNPVWHCSLALPKGERLDSAAWQRVCERHLQLMGIDSENYMWVAVRHDDTDFDHVHLVVSRIGLDGALWHGRNDVRAAIESTQLLEREFGLRLTPGLSSEPEHPKRTKGEAARRKRTGQASLKERMQAILNRAIKVGSFEGFVQVCNEAGLQLLPNLASTGRMNGFSFRFDGEVMKASDLGSKYKWAKLAERTGFDQARHMPLIQELAAAAKARKEAEPEDILQAVTAMPDEEVRPARRSRTIDLLFVRLDDGTYAWKRSQSPAFRDLGDRIRFNRTPETAVKAALQLAREKGWLEVKAVGSIDFRRRAWVQGWLTGVRVVGYEPTRDDVIALAGRRRDEAMKVARREADPLLQAILVFEADVEARLAVHWAVYGAIPSAPAPGQTVTDEQHAFAELHADEPYRQTMRRMDGAHRSGSTLFEQQELVRAHCERIIAAAATERSGLFFRREDLRFWVREIRSGRMPSELRDGVNSGHCENSLAAEVVSHAKGREAPQASNCGPGAHASELGGLATSPQNETDSESTLRFHS
ncbi:LPD7 domain-containing protein [Ralstonia sp. SM1884_UCD616_TZ26]|uniref:relaxase/mobilization nuclease domain-containing protein n=1 Tax=Ralstonia pseudosolanacearum TaxID=1310165 RepID=UPI003396D527